MKFENTEVWGFSHALRGMRNPMNSWDKSDSKYCKDCNIEAIDNCPKVEMYYECVNKNPNQFIIGSKDMDLAQRLIKAGPEHRKFMRQIYVSVDITAPLYFFKEFDTYKINTTANSTSTMHKLATTPITWDCFEHDDCTDDCLLLHVFDNEPYKMDDHISDVWDNLISVLETIRVRYLETKDKRYWKELIRLLPESWLQTRTITMSYENLINICRQRRGHKLSEWHQFIDWAKALPYAEELIFI